MSFKNKLLNAQLSYDIIGNTIILEDNFNSILSMDEIRNSTALDKFTMLQDTYRIAEHFHLREVMRTDKYGFTFFAQLSNNLAYLPLAVWVKSIGWFIQNQKLRIRQ